jgi:predicted RNA-binding Zn-ribbon protein involved in translation (DUF1610 family)
MTSSKVHMHTPAHPRAAACGDASAQRFTAWRWKSTCDTCKLITAPRPLDAVVEQSVVYRKDLPIRYSRLVAYVRTHARWPEAETALAEFERERQVAAHCPKCGPLADPITLLDVPNNRMVFACPQCATPEVRAQWEKA